MICLADMDWDHQLWTNRQHLMSCLPGVDPRIRVLYASPPRFVASRWSAKRLSRSRRIRGPRPTLFTRQVAERVWVSQPLLPLPVRWHPHRLRPHAEVFALRCLQRGADALGMRAPVIWAYGPATHRQVHALPNSRLVYDVVDDYLAQSNHLERLEELTRAHESLLAEADVVFTTSPLLRDACAPYARRVVTLGNAADVRLFATCSRHTAKPRELADAGGPIIGFHGALTSYKLDADLVRTLAARRPDWEFLFIGPVQDPAFGKLGGLPNVTFIGPRTPKELCRYLSFFDAGLLPYRTSEYTRYMSPLKLYEFLAAGIPAVQTGTPVPEPLAGFVAAPGSAAETEAALQAALQDRSEDKDQQRRDLAAQFSWDQKARTSWEEIWKEAS